MRRLGADVPAQTAGRLHQASIAPNAFCYRNRRRRYVEHLVFFLHAQSFLLLMLLVEAKLPGVLSMVGSLWVIVYFLVALKRVYDGNWADTLVRGAAALVLTIATFLVTAFMLVYASLEL